MMSQLLADELNLFFRLSEIEVHLLGLCTVNKLKLEETNVKLTNYIRKSFVPLNFTFSKLSYLFICIPLTY